MMNDQAIDNVLSSLAKSYEKAPVTERSPSSDKQTPRVKRTKVIETSEIIPEKGPRRMLIQVPEKGTLSARDFLRTMNRVSDRNEQIRAIAGYVGYDPAKEFGEQEYWARNQAKKELSPIKEAATPPSGKRVSQTIRGYVAGMPNTREKRFQDLKGRENLAIEEIARHEEEARKSFSGESKTYHTTMAQVERERLSEIRRQLREMSY